MLAACCLDLCNGGQAGYWEASKRFGTECVESASRISEPLFKYCLALQHQVVEQLALIQTAESATQVSLSSLQHLVSACGSDLRCVLSSSSAKHVLCVACTGLFAQHSVQNCNAAHFICCNNGFQPCCDACRQSIQMAQLLRGYDSPFGVDYIVETAHHENGGSAAAEVAHLMQRCTQVTSRPTAAADLPTFMCEPACRFVCIGIQLHKAFQTLNG